VQDVIAFSPV
jgi:hypothetical protein